MAAIPQLDDPRVEAFGMLLEAHAEVLAAVERDHRCEGVPVSWLAVLIRLARTPGHELRMTELARQMTISTSGLTRLVDRMEQAGLVERRSCPSDRRGLLAGLTTAGLAEMRAVAGPHLEAIDRHFARHLRPDELETLTGLLRRVRDGLRQSGQPIERAAQDAALPDSPG